MVLIFVLRYLSECKRPRRVMMATATADIPSASTTKENSPNSSPRATLAPSSGGDAPHSGTKCLKPARNRFISVCYIVISQLFKATFNISVSGKWMNFIFKIRQIIAGISQNSQFPKFIISISGGFLTVGPFVRATSHNNFSWKLTNLL